MEEERRLPRNIRQIGEKEEHVRVYLEDYVYTFIHKLEAEKESRAGILLGSRENAEGKRCFFINGAVELEGLIGEKGVCFSEDTWKNAEEEIARYFSDSSICGWFICGGEDSFPDRDMLKSVHTQVFAGENCLMYWKEENDCFWVEEDKKMMCLAGYYVYYERNFQMQNYMLSRREHPVSEMVDDQAAQNFRKIMKTKQHQKRSAQGIWTQAGTVAAAAVIFVGSVYLIGRFAAGNSDKDDIPAFAVGASVERLSVGSEELSDEITEEESGGSVGQNNSRDSAKEDDEDEAEQGSATLKFYRDEKQISASDDDGQALKESGQSGEKETDSHTLAAGTAGEKSSPDKEDSAEETSAADGGHTLAAGAPVSGQKYTIQPGDTLADISIRFYGSTDMIMKICSKNEIENPNTIFIGQEIELP